MRDTSAIVHSLDRRRSGHSLPREFYTDRDIYDLDLEAVFEESWLMAGFTCELPKPGNYLAMTIGRTPVVILRDRSGATRGFFNTCRHRGAQLCADGAGRSAKLVCPYHQWTYDLDGKLQHAGEMPEDFDAGAHSLLPIHVEVVAGAIYICLADEAPDFAPFRKCLEPMLAPMGLENAKLAHSYVLVEKANWKLVMENGRECYHCAACHPELGVSFPVGVRDDMSTGDALQMQAYRQRMAGHGLSIGPEDGSWWQIARFPLNEGSITMSRDGLPLVKKPLVDLDGGDVGSLRFAIEPHNFCHALGDFAFMFSAYPVSPEETHVVAKWLVHKDAVEGVDYDLATLVETWDKTNLQDRDLAENNQRGVNGKGYVPGPYSPSAESFVIRFVDWYCERLRAHMGVASARISEVA
ncbi:Anthranilate 1,2-dioxygenase large subunit [Hartmannibacter diazotrophicus]|uniref:Anthranilate 1,2-dioxygenase large subunit n=1 Tax=Hartmannibacter diazotrophicus TaxID=1482074 RepID=A0A2C9DCN7_9HYPH|nr:aromatic ring-hydroxylating dioxygenase subunit alpha [Hartmannibacter diazotrophicus]SON58026.1 Anthranilate 1,2-dioxygenase large subunit [Hartmannibacter diazotrophicus]